MPHLLNRQVMPKLKRLLTFFPVVAIQGARQTGKSLLARDLLGKELPSAKYLSFDDLGLKASAQASPSSFLETAHDFHPLVVDEAQKVPDIFDAIKLTVDQYRKPGRFLLLGSTEFSRLARIRESLTGRMGRVRLFPLNTSEAFAAERPSRAQLLQYLERGGMPGIFAVRSEEGRDALWQDWLGLICERDIFQFKSLKLDADLAYAIMLQAAALEEPTRSNIAKRLRVDARRVETHLKALTELFALQRLNPHPSGTGKPIYLPMDAGIAKFLGASQERCLHVWLMVERMSHDAYFGVKKKTFTYYRSTGKRMIHWVEESIGKPTQAFQLLTDERLTKIDAALMNAFLKKNPRARGKILAPIREPLRLQGCSFAPWEAAVE